MRYNRMQFSHNTSNCHGRSVRKVVLGNYYYSLTADVIVVYVNDSCSNYADMFGLCHTSLYHYYTNNKCTFRKAVAIAYRPTSYNGPTTINSVNRITKSQAGFWMPDTIRNSGSFLITCILSQKLSKLSVIKCSQRKSNNPSTITVSRLGCVR